MHRKAGLFAVFYVLLWYAKTVISPAYAQAAKFSDLEKVVGNVISLLAPAAAIAFLIMVIIGAYKYITSGGDPKATAGARSTLTYAILGGILVVGVWLLLVAIAEITGAPVTTFTIPTP